jgi:hypothetical protein
MRVKHLAQKNKMTKGKIGNVSTSWVPSEFNQKDLEKAQAYGLISSDDRVIFPSTDCHGFVNRSAIEVGVWRFVEGGEHGGAIRDGGSTSLPSFRSRDGGEILRAAIIHYMATSARLQ